MDRTDGLASYKKFHLYTMRRLTRVRVSPQTPNEVMYGTRLRTSIDVAISAREDYSDFDDYHRKLFQDNLSIFSKVSENIERAQTRMKKYYDHGTRTSEIVSGDLMLVKYECRPHNLAPIFKGPWIVTERRDVNLHINDPSTGRNRVVHINRCKKAGQGTINSPTHDEDPEAVADTDAQEEKLDGGEEETVDTRWDFGREPARPRRQRRPPDRYGNWVIGYAPNAFEGESGVK